MTELEFTPEEMAQMVDRIKAHFAQELDREIGSFDAEREASVTRQLYARAGLEAREKYVLMSLDVDKD